MSHKIDDSNIHSYSKVHLILPVENNKQFLLKTPLLTEVELVQLATNPRTFISLCVRSFIVRPA